MFAFFTITGRVEYVVLDEERERLERNHERFAELLEQIERRTEELQLLQQLIELRLREVEVEAHRVRRSRALCHDGASTSVECKPNESLIRSSAYGKCTICLEEEPLDPVGCIYCQQLVGCRSCVNRWYLPARFGGANHGQCPLCRHEWLDQPEVMGIFFLKDDF
ncbi:hypothetical protein ANCCAN_22469 [Ancylostoma caninum]|uniref:RING-type domain-containing protein n=1 Tax=Ancylostoma caninum TaxID=29170 RepID=A0A368FHQ8_ANCCA|nr:hypothetical protein ANCCAN_22469 [Ancylostoma caninum]